MIGVSVDIPDLAELLKDETRDVMRLITFGSSNLMKVKIQEPKSGKTYARGRITKADSKKSKKLGLRGYKTASGTTRRIAGYNFHRASAPGEAPANDSSNLVNTIMPDVKDLQGEINLAFYGLILEGGADGAGRSKTVSIAARPFIIPSIEEILQDL